MGKSLAVNSAEAFTRQIIPKEGVGATSMTMAAMTDFLVEARRIIACTPGPALEYHSLYIFADELSTFMNDWKNQSDLIAGLTKFYDCSPYSQGRRTTNIRIAIEKPQVNILTGSTPSNLMRFIPDWAWDQGFTSRIILVYSGARPNIDIFKRTERIATPDDMLYDLSIIDNLVGQFGWTDEYADAMNKWQENGYEPTPNHPRLAWYNERRRAHMLKLSMVSSVDRSDDLLVTINDYRTALEWLIEAEHFMPDVFRTGAATADSKAMDDIYHFIEQSPGGVPEHKVKNFAIGKIPAPWILQSLTVMEGAGLIKCIGVDKLGMRIFVAVKKDKLN